MAADTSSGGGDGVPPGFRFHPTDEELLHFYLKKKLSFQKFEMEVIREMDLNKIEPWELQERCKIGSTPQDEWYFFSHKDRKYPTGSRTNRATGAGFWKATGRDKCIRSSSFHHNKIGMRKTLVFYRGRAPHGQKTDWIMHEYRLEEDCDPQPITAVEDGWVVCRVFKKKNLLKKAGNNEGGGCHDHGNSTGIMIMMMMKNKKNNSCHDHQLNMISSSEPRPLFINTQRNNNINATTNLTYVLHPHDLNYNAASDDIPHDDHHHQYKPIRLTNGTTNHYSHHHDPSPLPTTTTTTTTTTPNADYDHQTSCMQAKQFMLSRDDCKSASPAAAGAGYQASEQRMECNESRDEWDRLVIATSHHHDSSTTSAIHPLTLPSEMDFWAYNGK
ncbi:hypothetical protein OROHE_027055 [Orobanche hederae]